MVTDHVRVQVDTHGPDMSELLRDIRSQYEVAAKKNREETEAWYNSKVSQTKQILFRPDLLLGQIGLKHDNVYYISHS